MPLHRIKHGGDPAAALKEAVDRLEADGEAVVRWTQWSQEWHVLTAPKDKAKPKATPAQNPPAVKRTAKATVRTRKGGRK